MSLAPDDPTPPAVAAPVPTASADPLPAEGSGNALPAGTMLGEFELLAVAGEGGFAIVYRAWDHSLKRQVALKEYLPATLAMRHSGLQVLVKPGRQSEAFWKGLDSFVMEARLLARFDHPALVKVFRFWEANGTAYMVMPFYEGRTLRDELRGRSEPPDEATLLGWLGPVADALAVIHAERWYHRDVAPDNVLLLANSGRPLLLDFGAARQVIGDMTQALTVILKPGYAPIEQYTDIPGVHQGPWTDLYALAAVAHFAICGKTPPPSVGRMLTDSYQPLAQVAAGRYSDGLLQALDRALSVKPEGRPQSIEAFKQSIGLHGVALAQQATSQTQLPGHESRLRTPAAAAPNTLAAAPAPMPGAAARDTGPVALARPPEAVPPAKALAGQRVWLPITVLTLLAAVGGAAWLLRPAPPAAPTAALPAALPAATAPPAAASPAPPARAVPGPAAPWDVAGEFARVVAAQSAGWGLDLALDKPTLRIARDKLVFTVRSLQEGYVYVYHHSSDGQLQQLYPNGLTPPPRIAKGGTLRLPQGRLDFNVEGPAGPSQLLVMVSRWPRNHPDAAPRDDHGFLSFAVGAAAAASAAAASASQPLLAGRPVCTPAGSSCSDAYGATRVAFTVTP